MLSTCHYSRLASKALCELLREHYGLTGGLTCQYHVFGLHDNYLVEHGSERYICRVYRNDWRSPEEIHYELDVLTYLRDAGAPVAAPMAGADGQYCFYHHAPEGVRALALFPYAPGSAPGNRLSPEQSHALGMACSRMHQLADGFTPLRVRQPSGVEYLLDASLLAVREFLDDVAWRELQSVAQGIRADLPSLPTEAPFYGLCSGDINPRNVHIDTGGALTLFDFDQCGLGWRAFDIAKFFSSILAFTDYDRLARQFLGGYQSVRELSGAEQDAMPAFVRMALIWVMAIHARNAERIGYHYLGESFWSERMAQLSAYSA